MQQNLALFDVRQEQIAACDRAIAGHLRTLTAHRPTPAVPLPAARQPRRRTAKNNDLTFDVRPVLFQLTDGVDLNQIDGIGPLTAIKLLAEITTMPHSARVPSAASDNAPPPSASSS